MENRLNELRHQLMVNQKLIDELKEEQMKTCIKEEIQNLIFEIDSLNIHAQKDGSKFSSIYF